MSSWAVVGQGWGGQGGGRPYFPAGQGQPQAVGQAPGPVMVHELGQAGEGHGVAEVQPARPPPDLVVPHGLPVPHWSRGDTCEQACAPLGPPPQRGARRRRGVRGGETGCAQQGKEKPRPRTPAESRPAGLGPQPSQGSLGMEETAWTLRPAGQARPEGPGPPHARGRVRGRGNGGGCHTREHVVGAWLLAGPDQEGPGLRARGLQPVRGLRAGDAAEEPPGGPEPTLTLRRPHGTPPPPHAASPDPQLPSDTAHDPGPSSPIIDPECPRWLVPGTKKGPSDP